MIDKQTIVNAKSLVTNLEAGDKEQAQKDLDSLFGINETNLFHEVGRLTRDLHDTLQNFHLDNRLTSIAAQDIPDAKDRLEYVISMTADAANKTMDAVEKGITITDDIKDEAAVLNNGWLKVRNKELEEKEFEELCSNTEKYISSTAKGSLKLHDLLHQALMAQDYQDLTGQVIKRVIQVVRDVEDSLVETIKIFGDMPGYHEAVAKSNASQQDVAGPAMHADERNDVVKNQDDVDDLLSSLGF